MTAGPQLQSRPLAKNFRLCLHESAPLRQLRPTSGRATLTSKKSCSLAEKQPVSEPRPVPIRLEGALETGSRGATFAWAATAACTLLLERRKEPVPCSPGALAPAITFETQERTGEKRSGVTDNCRPSGANTTNGAGSRAAGSPHTASAKCTARHSVGDALDLSPEPPAAALPDSCIPSTYRAGARRLRSIRSRRRYKSASSRSLSPGSAAPRAPTAQTGRESD
jgi:hypothetical protein